MTTVIQLREHGAFFATRAIARRIREEATTAAAAAAAGELIMLDFTGVEAMTVSFGDELVGKLAGGPRPVAARGATVDVQETIATVLRRRGLSLLDGA